MCGVCTLFRGCRLYRPRWTLVQFHMLLLLECVGSVPPSAGVVCTDLVRRSFSFTCCRCLRVWSLYPLPRVSSVPTTRDALAPAALMRGARTPFRERRLHRLQGTLIHFHNLVAALVRGPCISLRGCRRITDPAEQFLRRCFIEWGLYPVPPASSIPTTRDAL